MGFRAWSYLVAISTVFIMGAEAARMSFAFRPVWLLFGDSITQYGFEPQGWGMHIASQYERRVDIINRGFGGYNTRWALELLPWVTEGVVKPQLATIFFGANDAALPDRTSARQHVPLGEYISNVETMVHSLQTRGVEHVVLLTPPPIHEPARVAFAKSFRGVDLEAPERTNAVTGTYASALCELGRRLGVPCVDLWTDFQRVPGWEKVLLRDGLHLTPAGQERVARALTATIRGVWPHLRPEDLPMDVPDWKSLDAVDGSADLQRRMQAKAASGGTLPEGLVAGE